MLLVEDDEPLRDALSLVLAKAGYLVLPAGTAHDAIGQLQAPLSPVNVVLLDVHLPDASGIDLCARIQQSHPTVPIVICTGQADADEGARLLRLGVFRYFLKPMTVDELLATMEAALDDHWRRAGGPPTPRPTS